MKKIALLSIIAAMFAFSCGRQSYFQNPDGVTLKLKKTAKGSPSLMRIAFITDDIVHVTASDDKSFSQDSSLVALTNFKTFTGWKLIDKSDTLFLESSKLKVGVLKSTGQVFFMDENGNMKLQEVQGGGKTLIPLENSKPYNSISQVFNSPDDEALYGLGQYQNGEMNLKGCNVDIAQHNIVAVVPLLVSNKNYGLLWDNYSRTHFGDPREYKPLSDLRLYDKDGNEGGLDVIYSLKDDPQTILAERKESVIDAKYLPNLDKFPKDVPLQKAKVVWEGSIESSFTGEHRFQLFASGYTKLWLNGELVADFWRQSWNPWYKKFKADLKAGEKNSIRIEWIPDSDQPYISLSWLDVPDMAEQGKIRFTSESGKQLEYYYINGSSIDEVISGYRTLTGKAPIMPRWAMGLWQSRQRYKTQDEILSVVKEFRDRKIPLDNIVLDWFYWPEDKWGDHGFDPTRFKDPAAMVKDLHEKLHAQIMISVWPKFYTGTENYKKMDEKGWLYKANIDDQQKDWVGYVSTFYDAFNKDARDLYWQGIRDSLLTKGFDGWWMDATEPDILSNVSFADRKRLSGPTAMGPSENYFNAYSLIHTSGVYEGLRRDDPDRRVFILTRSSFAGQQRYAAATWSGDLAATWEDLRNQIPAGLNFCIAGIPFWTTDIGGFSVEKRYENPDAKDLTEWRELVTRWFQFGTFCPLLRVHGEFPYREMFNVAPEGSPEFNSMLYYDKLRYRLLPYIYTLDGDAHFNDYTIMRALVMDFENDSKVNDIADEFMFGPSILVSPVYNFEQRQREVYLPAGTGWFDFYSGSFMEGGQTVMADAPLGRIPLFAKEGSILLMGPELQYAAEKPADPIDVIVYQGKDGSFSLYEDEGTNYNYEKKLFTQIEFSYNENDKTLYIGDRKGEFPGMLLSRTFRIATVNQNKPGGQDKPLIYKTVKYDGNALSISLQ